MIEYFIQYPLLGSIVTTAVIAAYCLSIFKVLDDSLRNKTDKK